MAAIVLCISTLPADREPYAHLAEAFGTTVDQLRAVIPDLAGLPKEGAPVVRRIGQASLTVHGHMLAWESNEPPSLLQRAIGLARVAAASAANAASGQTVVADRVTAAARIAICAACPKLIQPGTCSACGCFVRIKAKLATARCPDNRWPTT